MYLRVSFLKKKIIGQCLDNFQKKKGGPGRTHKAKTNAFRETAHALSGSAFSEEKDM
jgi:hypothetical protein